jgi:hypothetical protein
MADDAGKLKSCVIHLDSGQQAAGHAAGWGHAAGIEGFVVHFQKADVGGREIEAVKRFRPDFLCSRPAKAHDNQETKGGAEITIFVVWAVHNVNPLNLGTTLHPAT